MNGVICRDSHGANIRLQICLTHADHAFLGQSLVELCYEGRVSGRRSGKQHDANAGGEVTLVELHHRDIPFVQRIETLRRLAGVVNRLAVQPPVLVRSQLDDFSLQVEFRGQVRAVQVEINGKTPVELKRDFRKRREELLYEDVRIQVDGLLVARVPISEVPFKERKI